MASQMALLLSCQLRTVDPRLFRCGYEDAWFAFLRSAFPFPAGFNICPECWPSRGRQCFRFEVKYGWEHTVFVVHQKSAAEMDYAKELKNCPLPAFRGLSALGTTFALYAEQHTTITPPSPPTWSHSVLDLDGVCSILEIVEAVKKDCKELKRSRRLTAKATAKQAM
ncbi:uncharacterized protein BXZ73DRAFT_78534 [Epithele typhae]|uniref:uncharacterized protein n=1 Tax=Epithele typhae TaxID=378194 RepID=UPI002008AE93|nr:uncharacterized protein BXZ73DRAFT_78534 [Epithele typhae]KAH9927504.1 hypothetical protein BXZ73DRAFT_78534 [Epithele typhae]